MNFFVYIYEHLHSPLWHSVSLNDFQVVWYQSFWKVNILNFYSSKSEEKKHTFYILKQKYLYELIHINTKMEWKTQKYYFFCSWIFKSCYKFIISHFDKPDVKKNILLVLSQSSCITTSYSYYTASIKSFFYQYAYTNK